MSYINTQNSGSNDAAKIRRVFSDAATSQYEVMPGHLKRIRKKQYCTAADSSPAYRLFPSNRVSLKFPQFPINPLESWLEMIVEFPEIPCKKTPAQVTAACRKDPYYADSLQSRPGMFGGLPFMIKLANNTMPESHNSGTIGTTELIKFTAITTDRTTTGSVTAEATYNNYINSTNGNRTFMTKAWGQTLDEVIQTSCYYHSGFNVVGDDAFPNWTITGHSEQYQVDAEPGRVLDNRVIAYSQSFANVMQSPLAIENGKYEISPDEAMAAWCPYSMNPMTQIHRIDSQGYFCRNALQYFQQLSIGTSSNPGLIELYDHCGDIGIIKSGDYEDDQMKSGDCWTWSTSMIPNIFKWQSNGDFIGSQWHERNPLNTARVASGALYQTANRGASLSAKYAADRTVLNAILNPFPYDIPAHERKFVIPLSIISQFFGDGFLPVDMLTDDLQIDVTFNSVDQMLDWGTTLGFDPLGGRVCDLTSFGNANHFIRQVLGVQWQGPRFRDVHLSLQTLEFPDPSIRYGVYNVGYGGGGPVQRPIFNHNIISGGSDIVGNTEIQTDRYSTVVRTTSINLGVVAMIIPYYKLDGVNNGMYSAFDEISLEFGHHQGLRLPANSNEFLDMSTCQRLTLTALHKNETRITNPNTDLRKRFDNPLERDIDLTSPYYYKYGSTFTHRNAGFSSRLCGNHDILTAHAWTPGGVQDCVDFTSSVMYQPPDPTNGSSATNSTRMDKTAGWLFMEKESPDSTDIYTADTSANPSYGYRVDPMEPFGDRRSVTNRVHLKPIITQDTHYLIWDLRGDDPCAGTSGNIIMSGLFTSAIEQSSLTVTGNVTDLGRASLVQGRRLSPKIDVVREYIVNLQPIPTGQAHDGFPIFNFTIICEKNPNVFDAGAY